MNRDELKQAQDELDLTDKLLVAKEAFWADGSDKNFEALNAIKAKLHTLRTKMRTAAAPPEAGNGDGVATPDTVVPKTTAPKK